MSHRHRAASALALPCMLAVLMNSMAGKPPFKTFGDPLPGLTPHQLALFQEGAEAFAEAEFAGDGLGPVFTSNACGNCHSAPELGGSSAIVETRIGRWSNGQFDELVAFGGPIIQNKAIDKRVGFAPSSKYRYRGEVIPPQANVRAGRRSTPLYGLGLVEAVPDETFFQIARFQQQNFPQMAGRPHVVQRFDTLLPAVGRFGWKSQIATLFDFAGDAYANEMGITTPLVPHENAPQGDQLALDWSPLPYDVPNEPDNLDLELFRNFMAMLAPPPRGEVTNEGRVGDALFDRIGCAVCHVRTLTTGPNPVAALNFATFAPFSDFLLHDMGTLGDKIQQGDAGPAEMRTAPLWGLSAQPMFLHDGRARTIRAAILAHDGQGRDSRIQFLRLTETEKRALIAFLNSL